MSEYYYKNSTPQPITITESSEKLQVYLWIYTERLKEKYDLLDRSWKSSMMMDPSAFVEWQVMNKRGAGNRIWLKEIRIYTMIGADFLSSHIIWGQDYGDGTKILNNGYARNSIKTNNDVYDLFFTRTGVVEFWGRLKWHDKNGNNHVTWHKVILTKSQYSNGPNSSPTMTVYAPELQSIYLSGNQKTAFYKHESFTLGDGSVKAVYKYVADESLFEETVFSNYNITPSLGSELVSQGQNTATVEFGGCRASYSYNVYGVDEDVTFPALPQVPRYLPAGVDFDLIKEQYLYGTITYEDGTTSNNERSDMSFSIPSSYVGKMPVKYSIRIPKLCKWKTVNGFPEVVIDRRIEYGDGDDGQPMSPHYTEKSI